MLISRTALKKRVFRVECWYKSDHNIHASETLISIPRTPIFPIPAIRTRQFSRDNWRVKVSVITCTNLVRENAIRSGIGKCNKRTIDNGERNTEPTER